VLPTCATAPVVLDPVAELAVQTMRFRPQTPTPAHGFQAEASPVRTATAPATEGSRLMAVPMPGSPVLYRPDAAAPGHPVQAPAMSHGVLLDLLRRCGPSSGCG
jgi:hypothetical protein